MHPTLTEAIVIMFTGVLRISVVCALLLPCYMASLFFLRREFKVKLMKMHGHDERAIRVQIKLTPPVLIARVALCF